MAKTGEARQRAFREWKQDIKAYIPASRTGLCRNVYLRISRPVALKYLAHLQMVRMFFFLLKSTIARL